jgi:hypothetical protein
LRRIVDGGAQENTGHLMIAAAGDERKKRIAQQREQSKQGHTCNRVTHFVVFGFDDGGIASVEASGEPGSRYVAKQLDEIFPDDTGACDPVRASTTAFCALAVDEGFIPGAAHLTEPDPVCDGLDLPRASLAEAPGLVLNNIGKRRLKTTRC